MLDNATVIQFIHQFGYAGLAVGLVANCMGIPIASEVILPLTGVYASSVGLNLTLVIVVAILAQLVGFTLAYIIAKKGGVELLEKYGKYVFLDHKQIVRFHDLFKKHGFGIILAGSCVPGVHGYMGFAAGLAEMGLYSFFLTAVIGSTIWTLVLVGLGAFFKDQITRVISVMTNFGALTIVTLVLIGAVVWYSKARKNKSRRKSTR